MMALLLCRVSASLVDPAGRPLKFQPVQFKLMPRDVPVGVQVEEEAFIAPITVTAWTDAQGAFAVDLARGLAFEVDLPFDQSPERFAFTVPLQSSCDLLKTLFPYPEQIFWAARTTPGGIPTYSAVANPLNLAINQTVDLCLAVRWSHGVINAYSVQALGAPDNVALEEVDGEALRVTSGVGVTWVFEALITNSFERESPFFLVQASEDLAALPSNLTVVIS